MIEHDTDQLSQPVMTVARKDVATLNEEFTVQQALDDIRLRGVGEKIVYFYVVDAKGMLVGVVPTRRLLIASPDRPLTEVMIKKVVAIPETATVFDACEMFVLHKLLAFPVVDGRGCIQGVVDISTFAGEMIDLAERDRMKEVFESIGFRVSQVRHADPFKAFRYRFPWLMATIVSGTICALLVSLYEITLAKSLVLAFFLTLVLGLGESVSMQSMAMTIMDLHSGRPTLRWYMQTLRRELTSALLLGTACGVFVGLIVWAWFRTGTTALAIGASILLALCAACFLGLSIPALLHALKLDPKIAAGPVTLAITDVFTILFYFSLAAIML